LNKNDTFGEFLLFSNNPTYLGDIIANPNTKIGFIKKQDLLTLLKDPIILENYLCMLSKKSMANQEKIKIYSQNNIEDRILFYLFEESKKTNSKIIKIKSKENLALLLNIPRPSLSRSLIKLKEKSLIDYDKHSIKLEI
jgi:CRP-like cAMP-binding protein